MHTKRLASKRYHILGWFFATTAAAGCAGKSTPATAPHPSERVSPRPDARLMPMTWRSLVQFDRSDSIVLTLPGGATQVQRMTRHATFTVTVGPQAAVTVRLDSLAMSPAPGTTSPVVVGTIWTGRMLGSRVEWLTTTGAGPVVEDLRVDVEGLFPTLPPRGVSAGTRWADTSTTKSRVDIFETTQRLVMKWAARRDTSLAGSTVLPLQATGELEQSGKGSGAGVAMTMTGQGSRSYLYYLTKKGQVKLAVRRDSMNVLISVPKSHQLVPTVRLIRSRATFRDNTP